MVIGVVVVVILLGMIAMTINVLSGEDDPPADNSSQSP